MGSVGGRSGHGPRPLRIVRPPRSSLGDRLPLLRRHPRGGRSPATFARRAGGGALVFGSATMVVAGMASGGTVDPTDAGTAADASARPDSSAVPLMEPRFHPTASRHHPMPVRMWARFPPTVFRRLVTRASTDGKPLLRFGTIPSCAPYLRFLGPSVSASLQLTRSRPVAVRRHLRLRRTPRRRWSPMQRQSPH